MKCERCADYRETAGEVRGCVICVQDGTAAQIRSEVPDNAVLESLCQPDTGLANRFKPGSLPVEDEGADTEGDTAAEAEKIAEAPAAAKPKKKGIIKRLLGKK